MGFTATGVRPPGGVGTASSSMGYVFISHSRWDRPYAARLVTWLRAWGMPIWISGLERHCPAWQDLILPNVARCSVVVVLMTPRSELAPGVHEEVCYADMIGKPVIRLALDDYCFHEGRNWLIEPVSGSVLPGIGFLERLSEQVESEIRLRELLLPATGPGQKMPRRLCRWT